MTDFTITDVLAWARAKPADERYRYGDVGNCALCRFLRETGRCSNPSVGGAYWRDASLPFHMNPIPEKLHLALVRQTFGALVEAIEALCPEVAKADWAAIDAYLFDIDYVEEDA